MSRATRIYPVDVKRPSGITNWGQWPTDVEPTLQLWNRQGLLSFGNHDGGGPRVFKCPDCGEFCEHKNTAFIRTRREKKRGWAHGTHICDDCLIARARQASAASPPSQETVKDQPSGQVGRVG